MIGEEISVFFAAFFNYCRPDELRSIGLFLSGESKMRLVV